jgi:hypothetical protein
MPFRISNQYMPYLHAPELFATARTRDKGVFREGIAAASDGFLSELDHRTNRRLEQGRTVDVADRANQHRKRGKSGYSYAMRMDSSK